MCVRKYLNTEWYQLRGSTCGCLVIPCGTMSRSCLCVLSFLCGIGSSWQNSQGKVLIHHAQSIPTYTTRTVTCQPSRACRPRARYILYCRNHMCIPINTNKQEHHGRRTLRCRRPGPALSRIEPRGRCFDSHCWQRWLFEQRLRAAQSPCADSVSTSRLAASEQMG